MAPQYINVEVFLRMHKDLRTDRNSEDIKGTASYFASSPSENSQLGSLPLTPQGQEPPSL